MFLSTDRTDLLAEVKLHDTAYSSPPAMITRQISQFVAQLEHQALELQVPRFVLADFKDTATF